MAMPSTRESAPAAAPGEPLRLRATDRVLVVAPHPDDESIACGGLLLSARDAGAARQVVILTDGDNNPWPQRWIEKRWRIDAAARARWGAQRRAEAQAALDVLAVDAEQRRFLGLPDGALTTLLMQQPDALITPLRSLLAEFRPTLLALPALDDTHPDHSAAHIAARLAGAGSALPPVRSLIYSIHGTTARNADVALALTDAQVQQKRQAIACHATQMRLSGSRFLRFASASENYRNASSPSPPPQDAPLLARLTRASRVELHWSSTRMARGDARRSQILLCLQSTDARPLRWSLPAPRLGAETSPVTDDLQGTRVAMGQWRHADMRWQTELELPNGYAVQLGFAKLARARAGLVIYDRYAWQPIEIRTSN